jgi:hypothetical protein
MSTQKQISILQKQNDNIYSSLSAKGIHSDREINPSYLLEDELLKFLQDENTKLKDIAKQHRPPPQVKEPKTLIDLNATIIETKSKEVKQQKETDFDSADEENYTEPVKKFECIINMEDLKRAFFNGEYEQFNSIVKNAKLSLYFANYKYSSDKDGAPDFVAKNLIGGFVRNLEDYKKYLMVSFRCYQICTSKYEYKSLWIVNTTEPLNNVIGSFYEDFDFVKVNEIEIDNFLETIKRSNESNESNLLIEKYLH